MSGRCSVCDRLSLDELWRERVRASWGAAAADAMDLEAKGTPRP